MYDNFPSGKPLERYALDRKIKANENNDSSAFVNSDEVFVIVFPMDQDENVK